MTGNNETAAQRIEAALESEERALSWVADKSGMAYSTMRRKMHGGTDFTVSEVLRIAHALKVEPKSLLPSGFEEEAAA